MDDGTMMTSNPPPSQGVSWVPSPWRWPVNVWSLLMAFGQGAAALAYLVLLADHSPQQSSASALQLAMLCCCALQAAAAALALLLPAGRRRSRLALGFVTIAAAVANHCMYAGFVGVLAVAYPRGNVRNIIAPGVATVFLMALGDVMGFLTLLLGEDEEDDDGCA